MVKWLNSAINDLVPEKNVIAGKQPMAHNVIPEKYTTYGPSSKNLEE